jgi:glucose/arabinose dehydrogenase/cytochrome c2
MMARFGLMTLMALGFTAHAWGADANAGRFIFRQECTLCHTAEAGDDGGGQGPSLAGVLGRRAASNPTFGYTAALKASGLTWDAPTLGHFLSSPTTVVPGTAMVVAVPKSEDRDNLLAYFQALRDGTLQPTATARKWLTGGPPPIPGSSSRSKTGDWKNDFPGRTHRIDLAKLPAPYATGSARNAPKVIDRPPGAQLSIPKGFTVSVFSSDLLGPRAMRAAPNGDIFLTEMNTGRVKVLRPSADGATAESVEVFAKGLNLPFGMAFYPSGDNPQWLYVAESTRLVRYAYKVGQQHASGLPEVVVAQFYPNPGTNHITRDLLLSPDGKRLFVSVGSSSNVAENMPKKSATDIAAWEAEHGLGAAWGAETNRADVLVFDVDPDTGKVSAGRTFATGLRNCAGLSIQPATQDLWCTVNERDGLGDDLVPDYSTRVKQGAFFGWPWYYMGNHEDPRKRGERPDLRDKVAVPDVPYQAHSAPLNMVFYGATSGSSAFPAEYVGDGFAALHGSWNRAVRTGYKIVRLRMKDGVPTGEYDDFLVGFIADNNTAWGRPVGLLVAADGSLLFSDDGNNLIYRISYSH